MPGCQRSAHRQGVLFCSRGCEIEYQEIALSMGGRLQTGSRPGVRSVSADQSLGGTAPLRLGSSAATVPLFSSMTPRTVPAALGGGATSVPIVPRPALNLGAEGAAGLAGEGGETAADARIWRALAADRAINELRLQQGPLSGQTQIHQPAASPLSLSLGGSAAALHIDLMRPPGCSDAVWASIRGNLIGTPPPPPTAGDGAFDAGSIRTIRDNSHDESKLRAAPFRAMGVDEEVNPLLVDIVLNGVTPGTAAPVTLKDATGFIKIVNSSESMQYHRQINSIRQLTMYVQKGIQTSRARAIDSQKRVSAGRDVAKWRASVQHWLRWVQALQQFETACMQQYVRVVSPAIDAEAANEADDLFFKTINLMLMQHHCTVVMSEGASVFCVHWSAKMEKMAEVARLDFYKTPSRTKDAWATEHKNTLRARHGLGPLKAKARKAKVDGVKQLSDVKSSADSSLSFDEIRNAINSGKVKFTANQVSSLRKLLPHKPAKTPPGKEGKQGKQGQQGKTKGGGNPRASEGKTEG
jgi:hypothetical protein